MNIQRISVFADELVLTHKNLSININIVYPAFTYLYHNYFGTCKNTKIKECDTIIITGTLFLFCFVSGQLRIFTMLPIHKILYLVI